MARCNYKSRRAFRGAPNALSHESSAMPHPRFLGARGRGVETSRRGHVWNPISGERMIVSDELGVFDKGVTLLPRAWYWSMAWVGLLPNVVMGMG